jgi:hypothetical protein
MIHLHQRSVRQTAALSVINAVGGPKTREVWVGRFVL